MPRLPEAFDPREVFVDLAPDGRAKALPVDADFWPALIEGRLVLAGRLLSAFALEADIDHWECHPAGEEMLMMVSGAVDVLLDLEGGVARVPLAAGRMLMVPPGVWHTFDVRQPGTLLAITAGEGTDHRKR
ncbi:MAG: cupin domain-containing protein [Alphaproteobacteria bacterium]